MAVILIRNRACPRFMSPETILEMRPRRQTKMPVPVFPQDSVFPAAILPPGKTRYGVNTPWLYRSISSIDIAVNNHKNVIAIDTAVDWAHRCS
jgi:hypothetical protein